MTIQPDFVKEELLHELSESCRSNNQIPPNLYTRYRIKRGLRTIGRQTRLVYPYRRFWEVAARKGNKVVYGLDAHDPAEYLKKEQYDIVDEVIAGLDLHFIKELNFRHKL